MGQSIPSYWIIRSSQDNYSKDVIKFYSVPVIMDKATRLYFRTGKVFQNRTFGAIVAGA